MNLRGDLKSDNWIDLELAVPLSRDIAKADNDVNYRSDRMRKL